MTLATTKPAHKLCKVKSGEEDQQRPWVLIMYSWRDDTETVMEHFCEEDAVEEATKLLMENRRQTAYIGPMTKVMGVKKTEDAMHVVIDDTRTDADAWRDHFASDWPGSKPGEK